MAQTQSSYPGAIDTGLQVDYNPGDAIPSSVFEKMADAIKEIETELGTDPAGSLTDVKTRLAVALNDDGTLKDLDLSAIAHIISLIDNNAAALDIKEGANSYLKFVTTDAGESIVAGKTISSIGGTTISAAQWGYLGSWGSSAKAYNGNVQSIPNTTVTKIQLDTEVWDTNGEFDSTTNYRFTATVAGKYICTVSVGLNSIGDGKRCDARIHVNGTAVAYQILVQGAAGNPYRSITAVLNLAVDDYVEAFTYQDSGAAVNTVSAEAACNMMIHKVG